MPLVVPGPRPHDEQSDGSVLRHAPPLSSLPPTYSSPLPAQAPSSPASSTQPAAAILPAALSPVPALNSCLPPMVLIPSHQRRLKLTPLCFPPHCIGPTFWSRRCPQSVSPKIMEIFLGGRGSHETIRQTLRRKLRFLFLPRCLVHAGAGARSEAVCSSVNT